MARAIAPILADLERTGGPRFRFEHEPVDPGFDPMVVAYEPGGIGTGIWVDNFGDDEESIDWVSDQIYDAAIEASHGSWPACPLHPGAHPLVLSTSGWECRVTGDHIAKLGRLGI